MDWAQLVQAMQKDRNTRTVSIDTARAILRLQPVFLDTETTGTGNDAEIVDLAIVDWNGTILFNQLIRPNGEVSSDSEHIHGISNAMLAEQEGMLRLSRRINDILNGRMVIAYNAIFDNRLLITSYCKSGCGYYPSTLGWFDAMQLYSLYAGEWDCRKNGLRWFNLGLAAERCGIKSEEALHRALADAELTRKLFLYLAMCD